MFLRLLVERNVIREDCAMWIARFFGAHLSFQVAEPRDPTVQVLDIDGITDIDGYAMYLLFRWYNELEPSTAVVKFSWNFTLDIIISSTPNDGTANGQSRVVEWFLSSYSDSDTTDSDSVKDILIASGKELGLVDSKYFIAIMRHQTYHSLE